MLRIYKRLSLVLSLIFLTSGSYPTASEQQWLQCVPTARFNTPGQFAIETIPGYQEHLVPYLQARGVNDSATIENLVRQDIFHITHALSVLFDQDQIHILRNWLGKHFFLIAEYNTQIDHVGRELYGPLSFYLPLLDSMAAQWGLIYLRDLVFPSTQVVKVLQEHDPGLQGVTIGRVYFQDPKDGRLGCLELFQASPLNGKNPQCLEASRKRLALLTETTNHSALTPIDHLAVELGSVEEVRSIHERILMQASETLMPNQKEISHNPADGSTQTKALLRDSAEEPFHKIIEFVHYAR